MVLFVPIGVRLKLLLQGYHREKLLYIFEKTKKSPCNHYPFRSYITVNTGDPDKTVSVITSEYGQ